MSMEMKINGSYNQSAIHYAERQKEEQPLDGTKKTKKAENGKNDAKTPGSISNPQDEYIRSEKSEKKPSGLYRLGQDEHGNRKIFYEQPGKPGSTEEKGRQDTKAAESEKKDNGRQTAANPQQPGKPEKKCTANTDKVEREIRKLKEKKQQLEQQIKSASGDEKEVQELEKKLAEVENELRQKDNDVYRRQNTSFSGDVS